MRVIATNLSWFRSNSELSNCKALACIIPKSNKIDFDRIRRNARIFKNADD